MRKTVLSLFVAGFSFAVCDEDWRRHFPNMPSGVEVLSKREVFGLCEVVVRQKGNLPFTLYVGKDFVIAGEMIREGRSVSLEGIEQAQAKLYQELIPKLRELKSASVGSGQKEVFFISDPDCGFCNSIKKFVSDLAKERGYTLHLVWFPARGKEKAISFICERRTYEHYLSDAYGKSSCKEGAEKVNRAMELLKDVVVGTPTFIFPDGRVVVGANRQALEQQMK